MMIWIGGKNEIKSVESLCNNRNSKSVVNDTTKFESKYDATMKFGAIIYILVVKYN